MRIVSYSDLIHWFLFLLLQDYTHTDYPVSLPLRRPYSGNPEILDEEEFGESSASRAQDAELTAAEELGLMVYIVAYSKTVLFLVICIKAKSLCELNCIL